MLKEKKLLLKITLLVLAGIFLVVFISQSLFSQEEERIENDYTISVGDRLAVSVFGEPDLNVDTEVGADGTIRFPLIGNVKVAGLNPKIAEQLITDLLSKDYLVSPQVSIIAKQTGEISVFGFVRNPGTFRLNPGMGLSEAISMAGGLEARNFGPEFSGYGIFKVKLIRKSNGRDEVREIENIDKIFTGQQPDIKLKSRDKILVDQYGTFSVIGQVNRPGTFPLQKNVTIMQAISLANGFTRLAAIDATSVIRTENGKRKIIRVRFSDIIKRGDKSQDIIIMPGDTIVVPESFF